MSQSGCPADSSKEYIQNLIALLNTLLVPQGITAKSESEDNCLYILLESATVPEQQKMVAVVSLAVNSLKDASLSRVKIYGRQIGDPFTAWIHEITLNPESTIAATVDLERCQHGLRERSSDAHSVPRVE